METQREMLAKHGINHDDYHIYLSAPHPIAGLDDETTGIMVRKISNGKQVEAVMSKSRRQLARPDDTTYLDTIIELVRELEAA